jgi:hypothetical protein
MHEAYKSDEALCDWLRENSSGTYKLAGYAAERIETLSSHFENVQRVAEQLEQDNKDLRHDIARQVDINAKVSTENMEMLEMLKEILPSLKGERMMGHTTADRIDALIARMERKE